MYNIFHTLYLTISFSFREKEFSLNFVSLSVSFCVCKVIWLVDYQRILLLQ